MKKSVLIFLCATSFAVSGCDIIKSIKEAFSKPDKKNVVTAPAETVTAPQPETIQPQETSTPPTGDVLASIGNWTITKDEFQERLNALKTVLPDYDITNPQNRRDVLDELVRQQLLVLEAEKSGLDKGKDIVNAVDEFRRTVIVREAVRKLTENISVTEEEAKAFYEERKQLFREAEKWHIREIAVADKATADKLLAGILNGADFAETAKQNSTNPTAKDGGDLGFITQAPFPQMLNALIPLDVGSVSSVFKGPEDKYYIVKLEEKSGGEQIPYEKVKDDVLASLKQEKQKKIIVDHLGQLEKDFSVKINDALLK